MAFLNKAQHKAQHLKYTYEYYVQIDVIRSFTGITKPFALCQVHASYSIEEVTTNRCEFASIWSAYVGLGR
jgi:hypothetical protein